MERRGSVYNVLHGEPEAGIDANDPVDTHDVEEDHEDSDSGLHKGHHKHASKREVVESFDFNDVESMMWRKVGVIFL